jgi:hypothetical protein
MEHALWVLPMRNALRSRKDPGWWQPPLIFVYHGFPESHSERPKDKHTLKMAARAGSTRLPVRGSVDKCGAPGPSS